MGSENNGQVNIRTKVKQERVDIFDVGTCLVCDGMAYIELGDEFCPTDVSQLDPIQMERMAATWDAGDKHCVCPRSSHPNGMS